MEEGFKKTEKVESVEITVGTLFNPRGHDGEINSDRTDVITDSGEGDTFASARLRQDKEGKFIQLGGTGGPENFGQTIGQMTVDEVIEAYDLGWKKLGIGDFPEEFKTRLREIASKGPRKLFLKS